jgi:hypothetical protein
MTVQLISFVVPGFKSIPGPIAGKIKDCIIGGAFVTFTVTFTV